jgi:hypothetical protein
MRALPLPALLLLSLVACAHADKPSSAEPTPEPASSEAKPTPATRGEAPGPEDGELRGTVVETLDAAGYTYLRVTLDDGEEIWAAAAKQSIAVGAHVVLATSIKMVNFESKGLGRTFDVIYFVEVKSVGGESEPAAKDEAGSFT